MDHDVAKQLFLEQAAAFFDDLRAAAGNAPYGKVIDKAEHFAVVQGRELLRSTLEAVVQERIREVDQEEKKTVRSALAAELVAIAEAAQNKS